MHSLVRLLGICVLLLIPFFACMDSGDGEADGCGPYSFDLNGDSCRGVVCPSDGNECTVEYCSDGTCKSRPVTNGTSCTYDGFEGVCVDGACGENLCEDVDCDDGDACTDGTCDYVDGTCDFTPIVCDDHEECTDDTCDPMDGCIFTAVEDGTACAGGTCQAGVCRWTEYAQDFESLDQASTTALGDAGFLVYGTEFNPDGSVFNAYGPFPAPNNPAAPAFCLIAAGEGGPEQGEQQLVVFSDYQNRAAMTAGRVVEALTFQERTIVAADVGKTFAFSFDAKRGDIGGDSTAYGFIKTIDPANSFAETNLVQVDTTNLPITWGRLDVSLDIIPELEGQLIQFGFAASATNDEPSGNFYDNIRVVLEAP